METVGSRFPPPGVWTATEIDLVLCDACALPCTAARSIGVPSVCITNFCWDYCYRWMLEEVARQSESAQAAVLHKYKEMIDQVHFDLPMSLESLLKGGPEPALQMTQDYQCANLFLRLPGHTPMPDHVPIVSWTFKLLVADSLILSYCDVHNKD